MKFGSPSTDKKKILFVVNEAGEFVELRRVAVAARSMGYGVAFLFAQQGYINLKQDRASCRLNGFDDYFPGRSLKRSLQSKQYQEIADNLENGYIPYSLRQAKKPKRPFAIGAALALSVLATPLLALSNRTTGALNARRQKKKTGYLQPFHYARLVYKHVNPALVIYGQEFPGSVNSLLTKLCNRDNIPTLIIPFAVGTAKEMVESLSDKPAHDAERNIINKLAASLFPHWVNYYASKKLLRLPGQKIFLLEALDIAPDHPWIPNSSRTTCIGVESPEMQRYYQRMHFSESQLRVTGAAYDDILYRASKSDTAKKMLFRRLRLDPGKPLLVCAWPTDQYGSRDIPLEFPNYKALCMAWAKALAAVSRLTDFNVVIRPHPVTDPNLLIEVLRPYRLHHRVTDIDTLELVPACDLFIACVSSTLRWAAACGIPAINYDCYDYGYTDFNGAEGLFTTNRYSTFVSLVERLTENNIAYDEARAKQVACAKEWGMQDGHSMERIISLIDELTGNPSKSTYSSELHANE
ncbi:hypothetical protein E3Z27_08325 [Pseudomonas mediterranea]|uniref:hypothetical protein n=1 Tax=Pseudomonas mediterranea TaxID=183795 RepID=UPI0013183701|nr:hypothetical protein [Pseudomonas mediterranea]QHA81692.1 hypothetical protein E3Z27_08325 [Pseudomonas mediterranea]